LNKLEKTGKIHDLKISGKFETYEVCSIAKARHKSLNKERKGRIEMPGEQLYLDISSNKDASYLQIQISFGL
jgi:hypothetical protein